MKKVFMFLVAAMMLGMAMPTMAQQKKAPAKRASTTKSGTAANRNTATTVINFTAQGELGLFELRGPVKECIWGERKLEFDRNGMWIKENGDLPWSNYGTVKRDSKGRIILMGDEVESGESFTYNANGLIIKHITQYMDGRDVVTYTYNSKGECTKESYSYGDMSGSGKNTAIFTVLTRDSQGNWTKRKTQNGNVETRTIIYYEESTTAPTATAQTSPPINGLEMLAFGYDLLKIGNYDKALDKLKIFPKIIDVWKGVSVNIDSDALFLNYKNEDKSEISVGLLINTFVYSQIENELIKNGFEFLSVKENENGIDHYFSMKGTNYVVWVRETKKEDPKMIVTYMKLSD